MQTVEEIQAIQAIQAIRIEFLNECIKKEQTMREWHAERLVLCDNRIHELYTMRDKIIEQQHA